MPSEIRKPQIVLLGASVGRDWAFPALPVRMGLDGVAFEFVAQFAFDKGPALEERLASKDRRPAVAVLKECAAYFPGDLPAQIAVVERFVARCREADVVPVLATVAPVVLDRSMLGWIRNRSGFMNGKPPAADRLRALLAFNDAVHAIAQRERLHVLDIERALRREGGDRSLPPELTSGDGLHLNAKAYLRLDALAASVLPRVLLGARSPQATTW